MASRHHDSASAVQTHTMDEMTRPYFIHHRNQVGINQALMDLFRLIDLFLQTDENARNHLMALRALSDFVQQKQLVARMPQNPNDFYAHDKEDPTVSDYAQRSSSQVVTDLLRMVEGLQIPNAHPSSQANISQYPSHPRSVPFPGPVISSAPATTTSHHSHTTSNAPLIQRDAAPAIVARDDTSSSKDVTCFQGAADKLRSWLARPETAALKRFITSKRQRTLSTVKQEKHEVKQQYEYPYYSPVAHTNSLGTPVSLPNGTFPRTRSPSIGYANAVPRPWVTDKLPGQVLITTETMMHRDSLPPTRRDRKRSVSFSNSPEIIASDIHNEKPNEAERPKKSAGYATDAPPPISTRIRKKRPSSIAFVNPLPTGEHNNESRNSGMGLPSAASPMSTITKRTTMSSDASILDAPILQAKRRPVQHAQAIATGPESKRREEDETRVPGVANAKETALHTATMEERGLPPLPDDRTSSQSSSPEAPNGQTRVNVPQITVQPPSSTGTTTSRTDRMAIQNPRPGVAAGNHISIPIMSPSQRDAMHSGMRVSQHLQPPKLPLPTSHDSHASTPVDTASPTNQQRPISLHVPPTSAAVPTVYVYRSPSSRSYPENPHAQHSEATDHAYVTVREGGAASVVRDTSAGSSHRKPAPQIAAPLTPPSSRDQHRETKLVPSSQEPRTVQIVRIPHQNSVSPYPSPKSNHRAIPKHTMTEHRATRSRELSDRGHGSPSQSRKDPQKGSEHYRQTMRKDEAVAKSRFSVDTELSSATDKESRRRNVLYQRDSLHGREDYRTTDSEARSSPSQSRAEGKRYERWIPSTDESHTRSRSERVPGSNLRQAWKSRGEGPNKEWYIDESLMEPDKSKKRPSL